MSNLCWPQHQSEQAGLRLHHSPVSINVFLMDFLRRERFIIELWRRIWICIRLQQKVEPFQPFATRLVKSVLSILIFASCNHSVHQSSRWTKACCLEFNHHRRISNTNDSDYLLYELKNSDSLSLRRLLPLDQNSHRTQACCLTRRSILTQMTQIVSQMSAIQIEKLR